MPERYGESDETQKVGLPYSLSAHMHSALQYRPFRLGLTTLLLLQLATFGLKAPVAHADQLTGQLIINEINWAGSLGNSSDQWVELANATTQPVNFGTDPYTLTVGGKDVAVLNSGTVNPGSTLVLSRLAPGQSTLNGTVPDQVVPGLVLPMIDAQYVLKDGNGVSIDTANPSIGAPFAGQDGTGTDKTVASELRVITANGQYGPGDQSSSWATAQSVGSGLSAMQYGTPGELMNYQLMMPTAIKVLDPQSDRPTVMATFNASTPYGVVTFINTQTGVIVNGVGDTVSGFQPSVPLQAGQYMVEVASATSPTGDRSAYMGTVTSVSVPASTTQIQAPTLDAFAALTNAMSVTLTGSVGSGVSSVSASVNGTTVSQPLPTGAMTFSLTLPLQVNSSNDIQVVAVDGNGLRSSSVMASIQQSNVAPEMPASDHVVVSANAGGTPDTIQGQPGSVRPNSSIRVYADSTLSHLIGQASSGTDGSFPAVSIGDNMYATAYVVQVDVIGNVSQPLLVNNPITIAGSDLNLPLTVNSKDPASATLNLLPMAGVSSYLIKYQMAGGSFSTPVMVCAQQNPNCSLDKTITGLQPNTVYTVAVAAVDQAGNVSNYTNSTFRTAPAPVIVSVVSAPAPVAPPVAVQAPTSTPAPVSMVVPKATATPKVTPTPEASASPSATVTASASPSESGSVKSATTTTTRNWTPWIILGVLIGLAILATAGYFYWFGGEAGAAAEAASRPTPPIGKTPPSDKKDGDKPTRRW